MRILSLTHTIASCVRLRFCARIHARVSVHERICVFSLLRRRSWLREYASARVFIRMGERICVCVQAYLCVWVCIRLHIRTRAYVHVCGGEYSCVTVHAHRHMRVRVRMRMRMRMRLCSFMGHHMTAYLRGGVGVHVCARIPARERAHERICVFSLSRLRFMCASALLRAYSCARERVHERICVFSLSRRRS